jgi:protein dithiol oxidoreductase (disulfide-forming)
MMQRREFSQAALAAACVSVAAVPSLAQAQSKAVVAGRDYLMLDPRAPVEAPAGKVEVVEFFWYGCPHCHAFEPVLGAWLQKLPKDVAFRRVPVSFRDTFVPHQRLYYALEAMGLVDKLHGKVFHAIHVEKLKLETGEAIIEWVVKQGVDKAKFMDAYNAFSTVNKAQRGSALQNAYKVEGVPALGVAGQFYTDGSLTGSMERALVVVDALIAGARTKR